VLLDKVCCLTINTGRSPVVNPSVSSFSQSVLLALDIISLFTISLYQLVSAGNPREIISLSPGYLYRRVNAFSWQFFLHCVGACDPQLYLIRIWGWIIFFVSMDDRVNVTERG